MSHLNPQRLWLCFATWQEGLCRWNESYWSVDPERKREDPDRTGLITQALRDREVSLDESTGSRTDSGCEKDLRLCEKIQKEMNSANTMHEPGSRLSPGYLALTLWDPKHRYQWRSLDFSPSHPLGNTRCCFRLLSCGHWLWILYGGHRKPMHWIWIGKENKRRLLGRQKHSMSSSIGSYMGYT